MFKLSEDQTQITFPVPDFGYDYADSMSAILRLENEMPFAHEVQIEIVMEEDHIPLGYRKMPYEALDEFFDKKVEITCDIDPDSGKLTSKPSMIKIIK